MTTGASGKRGIFPTLTDCKADRSHAQIFLRPIFQRGYPSAVCCPRAGVTCVGAFAFPQGFCTVTVLLWSTTGALSPLQSREYDQHRFRSPCEFLTEGHIPPFLRTETKHFDLSRPASICLRSARSKGIQELQEIPRWDSHTPFAIPSPSCKV